MSDELPDVIKGKDFRITKMDGTLSPTPSEMLLDLDKAIRVEFKLSAPGLCYMPVIREEYRKIGVAEDEIDHYLKDDPTVTDDASKVNCQTCLEYIHA